MRLLVISHPCVNSLNQQFFAEVERLSGWELTIVAPSNWRDEYGRSPGLLRWPGYRGRLLGVPVWRPGDIPRHVYRTNLTALLRECHPDAVYVHHEPYAAATAQVWLASRRSGRPLLGFYSAQNIAKRYPWPFRQSERAVLRGSRFAFPVSEEAAAILRAKGCQAEITVLPLGVDPHLFRPHPLAAPLREELAGATLLIGYLGQITTEKGLATLLAALARLRDLPWRAVLAGSGPYEPDLDARVQALGLAGRVARAGFVPREQVPLYLSAFDLLVLPSETRPNWKEQFGRVITEAMACGTPVVGSDSGEIPHLLRDTGGGLIFPEGEPVALAARLRELIGDPDLRARLAARGRKAVLCRYTNEAVASRFIAVVAKTVGAARVS